MLPRNKLRERVKPSRDLPVSGLNAPVNPPRGRLLHRRRFLHRRQSRRRSLLAPPTSSRPPLDQLVRNIGPAVMRNPRAVAPEQLAATVAQRKIRRLRRLEFRFPLGLKCGPLRVAQQICAPQGGPLLGISRTAAAGVLEFIIGARPPPRTERRHHPLPRPLPGGHELLPRGKHRLAARLRPQPKLLPLSRGDVTIISDRP